MEDLVEEITVSVHCTKRVFDKSWAATAQLRATSLGEQTLVGHMLGDSRRKAAEAAVQVAFEVYDMKRPKRFRRKK